MTTPLPPCPTCKHYQGGGRCEAFPDRIPRDIVAGRHMHDIPYPGDGGIQYEPRERDGE